MGDTQLGREIKAWEQEGKGEEPGMRTGVGWGVGRRAQGKHLRVFLWEDEIWIPLELADPLNPDPDVSHDGSAASPPVNFALSSTQTSWGMTARALQALTPPTGRKPSGGEAPSLPFALYNPRSSSWILTPYVAWEGDRLEKHKECPRQYWSTRDGSRRAIKQL